MPVRFYHREHCHLCDEALELLRRAGLADLVWMIDIDGDPELAVTYGLRVPVIESADGMTIDWPFDAEAVRALLL